MVEIVKFVGKYKSKFEPKKGKKFQRPYEWDQGKSERCAY
jgi:hypothetical protein